MINMPMNSRRQGKSVAAKLAVEAALDAGKTVMIASKDKAEIRKRKGHLTRIKLCESNIISISPSILSEFDDEGNWR